MKLVDANVLIYAVNEDDGRNGVARRWLDDALMGPEVVGFAWPVVLAFLRLTTKIGLFPNPLPVSDALAGVRAWLDQPASIIAEPGVRHFEVMSGLIADLGTGGNLVTDAHLAALALENDATVVTYDTDFLRFRGVKSQMPT